MNRKLLRYVLLAVSGTLPFTVAWAGHFTTAAGQSYDGEIYKVLDGSVTLSVGEEHVDVALSDFDAASQEAIKSWSAEHPESVDVYTKWDQQPRIKSSALPVLPEQFRDAEFTGLVSVDLVLDEKGQVIHASIKKSTNAELEQPSLDAAKTWLFEPAMIDGKPVKSKLRVPFKFVNTPPAADAPPAG